MNTRLYAKKNGEIRDVYEKCIHERNSEGEITRSIGIVQDITERKQIEETIRARERYLHTILQTTADGFWIIDAQGVLIECNQAYCAMSGYS